MKMARIDPRWLIANESSLLTHMDSWEAFLPNSRIIKVLEMDKEMLWKNIFRWAEQFRFTIKNDTVTFGQGNIDAFIYELNKQLKEWGRFLFPSSFILFPGFFRISSFNALNHPLSEWDVQDMTAVLVPRHLVRRFHVPPEHLVF